MPSRYSAENPLVVVLPMPVNLGNARLRWGAKLARKKEYWRTLDTIASVHAKIGPSDEMPFIIPPAPDSPLGPVLVTVHMVLGGPMDDDNAMARLKFPVDWLVRRGYVKNDNRKNLRYSAFPTQEVKRSVPSHLRFTITPVEGF